MSPFEAAKILYQDNDRSTSMGLLCTIWNDPKLKFEFEFQVFCAFIELHAFNDAKESLEILESVISGNKEYYSFWERRTLSEQAILLDWHGQLAMKLDQKATAFESLSRAASLGRDTSLLWRQLGTLYIDQGELDLGLRYLKRSLNLFRQLELNLMSGGDHQLGSFTGKSPLLNKSSLEVYLELLLKVTRLAKGQRNFRYVREFILEMIHQFPNEDRLPKIRLLLEKTIVESSLGAAVKV